MFTEKNFYITLKQLIDSHEQKISVPDVNIYWKYFNPEIKSLSKYISYEHKPTFDNLEHVADGKDFFPTNTNILYEKDNGKLFYVGLQIIVKRQSFILCTNEYFYDLYQFGCHKWGDSSVLYVKVDYEIFSEIIKQQNIVSDYIIKLFESGIWLNNKKADNVIKSIIDKNLDYNNRQKDNLTSVNVNTRKFDHTHIENKVEDKFTCRDCMLSACGDCFGKTEICEDFKYKGRISAEEKSYWPEYGSILNYRINGEWKDN